MQWLQPSLHGRYLKLVSFFGYMYIVHACYHINWLLFPNSFEKLVSYLGYFYDVLNRLRF